MGIRSRQFIHGRHEDKSVLKEPRLTNIDEILYYLSQVASKRRRSVYELLPENTLVAARNLIYYISDRG